jgi:citrate lyase beta subunit
LTVIGDFPSLLPAGEQVLIEVIDHLFVDAVLLDLEDQDVIV